MLAAIRPLRLAVLVALGGFATHAVAEPVAANGTRRDVDLVIALDVSGSMQGLIESAKQRLWDITNELAQARPTPQLRVAVLSYGQPSYGEPSGFVHIDLPFTADLDTVNAALFAFRTDGGDEYVSRAIQTSLDELQWSQDTDALKIVFVAGNESAEQDPQLTIERATAAAVSRGIVVNAIYCGRDGDADALGWRKLAANTNGVYASIDQNAAAVGNVATPFDAQLAALNDALNGTYIAFGSGADLGRANQLEQDRNAAAMSPAASASRVVAKAGALYRAEWDLVDAVASGRTLSEIPVEQLPAELQALEAAELKVRVREHAERREELQSQIADVAAERNRFIAEQSRAAPAEAQGLDAAILDGVRKVAGTKGFSFERE
jgi:hypothetical protein